jgi:hypothetical protein
MKHEFNDKKNWLIPFKEFILDAKLKITKKLLTPNQKN